MWDGLAEKNKMHKYFYKKQAKNGQKRGVAECKCLKLLTKHRKPCHEKKALKVPLCARNTLRKVGSLQSATTTPIETSTDIPAQKTL
jgi:hypothetical protein